MDGNEAAYCGLYCGLCATRRRIPAQAAALRAAVVKEGYDFFSADIPALKEIYAAFRKGLDWFAAGACPGCRADGGYPACPVRLCVRERGLDGCADCDGWPCDKAAFLLQSYVNLPGDVARRRKIGAEKWAAEQEERARAGFCYADIRCPRDE
jgi:hypothetical protein